MDSPQAAAVHDRCLRGICLRYLRHPRAAAYVHQPRGSSSSRVAVSAATVAPWRSLEHSSTLTRRLRLVCFGYSSPLAAPQGPQRGYSLWPPVNAASARKRAIAFFDGQNLFAAARDAFGFTTASYGVPRLAQAIALQRGWDLTETRFSTGMPDRQESPRLHRHWTLRLRHMRAEGVLVTARPLRRRRRRPRLDDGEAVEFTVLEEKGIDVRIALDVVRAVLAGSCDVVLLFSQDQDFAELADEVRAIAREQQRWIRIASAYPVGPGTRNARGVERTDWIPIDRATYEACMETREGR